MVRASGHAPQSERLRGRARSSHSSRRSLAPLHGAIKDRIFADGRTLKTELELELIQPHMAQEPMLRGEVDAPLGPTTNRRYAAYSPITTAPKVAWRTKRPTGDSVVCKQTALGVMSFKPRDSKLLGSSAASRSNASAAPRGCQLDQRPLQRTPTEPFPHSCGRPSRQDTCRIQGQSQGSRCTTRGR